MKVSVLLPAARNDFIGEGLSDESRGISGQHQERVMACPEIWILHDWAPGDGNSSAEIVSREGSDRQHPFFMAWEFQAAEAEANILGVGVVLRPRSSAGVVPEVFHG